MTQIAMSDESKLDVLIERLAGLSKVVEVYALQAQGTAHEVNGRLQSLDDNIVGLSIKVGIQNGRVCKLEAKSDKEADRVTELIREQITSEEILNKLAIHEKGDLEKWKKADNVLIIANGWKSFALSVLVLSISVGIVISKFPLLMKWIKETLIPLFEIGI